MTQKDKELVEREALKACPFCGGEGKFYKCIEPDTFRIMCSWGGKCQASRDETDPHGYGSKQIAIEAWNTRATAMQQDGFVPLRDDKLIHTLRMALEMAENPPYISTTPQALDDKDNQHGK